MKEFVDFLGEQAPYDALDAADLQRLAAHVEVEYFPAGAPIVVADSEPLTHLWVVRAGAVEVLDRGRVVDQLGPGDTFGRVSLLSGMRPALSVRAADDSVCYRLPDPRPLLDRPQRLRFAHYGSHASRRRLTQDVSGVSDRAHAPVSRYARTVVTVDAAASVREVAALIGQAGQSCAVVTFPDGLGIVTDADFRRNVASGGTAWDGPVAGLATRPVLSVPGDTPLASAFLEMLEHGVHHLVLHDGGQRPVGVVRIVDVASAELRDPLVIRAAVEAAGDLDALGEACRLLPGTAVELFDTGVPAVRIGGLLAAVQDAVLRRLLALTDHVATAGTTCSWLVLGSLARREVLPASDIDTAIVWADPPDGRDVADRVRAAAGAVLDDLERLGLRRCADGANADNPRFSRSLSGWTDATRSWVRDAGQEGALLLSTMLADSRPVTELSLGSGVTQRLDGMVRTPQFLAMLLEYTLSARPPTGFVRDFVVEHSGEHRGELNLKRGGLRPVTSIGRWAAVVTGDTGGTTPQRLERAADVGLLTRDESDSLVGAYEQIYGLLLEFEVEALRSGTPPTTYLAPSRLDSLTRRHLRESFRAIAAVQGRLESQAQVHLPGIR